MLFHASISFVHLNGLRLLSLHVGVESDSDKVFVDESQTAGRFSTPDEILIDPNCYVPDPEPDKSIKKSNVRAKSKSNEA